MSRHQVPARDRFWIRVQTSDDCWIWTGHLDVGGYGVLHVRLPDGKYKDVKAHRFAYELLIGPLPSGLFLDHVECDNRRCVNPGHTIPTTIKANTLRSPIALAALNARKTHCKHGHPFTPQNTYVWERRNGGVHRACRICLSAVSNRWQKAKRAELKNCTSVS